MKIASCTLLLTLGLLFSTNALAADGAKHFPGVFVGVTKAGAETSFTYGVEYEYKFTSEWGAGAVYERANDAHHGDGVSLYIAQLFYHPSKYVRLGAGAGREKIGGYKPKTKTVYRLSASYEFLVGDIGIAPTLAVDFIDGKEAYVAGVAILMPF